MRASKAFMAAVGLLLATASAASAAVPVGSCPRPFEPATYEELTEAFPDLEGAVGAESLTALVDSVDANDNGRICWIAHPAHSASFTIHSWMVNLVDDAAALR
jgi:hypothetical protein